MEASCLELSIEGERLLKAGDYEGAIKHFEAGLRAGGDNDEMLSAIYNQLGNACFYLGRFHKALEYHKKDLEIAEKLQDRAGQAKAFGNLGNTFKALKNFPNAIRCCEAHLELTKELGDKLGEGRACYNLGNVHHAVGKLLMAKKDPSEQASGRQSVLTAINFYEQTLVITANLKDIAGEGRAVGNLGNAYTALGMYDKAIEFHQRRLQIAENSKDMAGKARACGNLGNAYSALNQFPEAIRFYQMNLAVTRDSGNPAGQAQAFYCLGATYMLMKNYAKAIENYEHHLMLATQVGDEAGRVRAWYNLRNANHALGEREKVVYYHKLIQAHQSKTGQAVDGIPQGAPNAAARPTPQQAQQPQQAHPAQQQNQQQQSTPKDEKKTFGGSMRKLFKKSTKKDAVEVFKADADSDDDDIVRTRKAGSGATSATSPASPAPTPTQAAATPVRAEPAGGASSDWLTEALKNAHATSPTQVHSPQHTQAPVASGATTLPEGDFFDMLMALQSTRLDDQRSEAPRAGGVASSDERQPDLFGAGDNTIDEEFFDMLVLMQGSRLDDQRSGKADDDAVAKANKIAQLDTDNMDFFEMLKAAKRA